MAHFHTHPHNRTISDAEITVDGPELIVGLWGPKYRDDTYLNVTEEGNDLAFIDAGESGNSKIYKIRVRPESRAKGKISTTIFAQTAEFQTWSKFNVTFWLTKREGIRPGALDVRSINREIWGIDAPFMRTDTKEGYVITPASFVPGDANNAPIFAHRASVPVDVAFYAAAVEGVERAFILLKPADTKPRKLTIVITHGFGQNDAYYTAYDYTNPLSQSLLSDVLDRFVLARWGRQLLAASSAHALLLPVRAKQGGQGELGPFATRARMGTEIIKGIAAVSGNAFSPDEVEVVTYSSGIGDANMFTATGGQGLNFVRGINQDPAGGVALSAAVGTRRQFLSGGTTHGAGRPGFELMQMARWRNEANARTGMAADEFKYLHGWCFPEYTMHLGMMM